MVMQAVKNLYSHFIKTRSGPESYDRHFLLNASLYDPFPTWPPHLDNNFFLCLACVQVHQSLKRP